ncbi:MAG: hypothetical protein IPH07_12450 [Deltaproteobacteria bacterium]|nr:hypothetical protein [Deltaproteobacteria bacterium]MBK8717112.1 hypothetical protein [Deltaproteobacteria bacterium]MBP7286364.1 hypothetical protein [Nannocystaceae bacterium]
MLMFAHARVRVASLVLSLCGCGLVMPSADQQKVAAACGGEAVAGTSAHERSGDGFAVFTRPSRDAPYEWSVDGVHFKLRPPKTLADVNTVFCLDAPEEVAQGDCDFVESSGLGVAGVQVVETSRSKGPSFARVGQRRTARLVDPSTGKTLAEHTITTDAPKCDAAIGEPTAASFRANPPSGISFAKWATAELGVSE